MITRYLRHIQAGCVLLLWLMAVPLYAQIIIPAPPQINARSYILLDADSGKILAQHNADERLPPASLTKLMTAYLVEKELSEGNIHLQDLVRISKKAWQMKGSLMFVEVGKDVSVLNLLKGLIIVSGNDAAVALAEHVAGGEDAFAQLMNVTAQKLDMKNSHFMNASGYPVENHYSTAHDLAILSQRTIEDFPERYRLYKQKSFQFGVDNKTRKPLKAQPNRNLLLWSDPSVDGLKTGHTQAAGYCLAASAVRDNRRLISVVMGTHSERARANETKKLLTYGFRFFENLTIATEGKSIQQAKVWKGEVDKVVVGLQKKLVITVPRGTKDQIKTAITLNTPLIAPIAADQVVGKITVTQAGKVIKTLPIVTLHSVKAGGFFTRLWDTIVLLFQSFF